jgi:DNA-binding protein HU-beta
MTKVDLVSKISSDCELTKAAAEKALSSTLEGITAALKSGDSLTLVGFGTFSVANRAARKGRNPKTGEEIQISARKVVKFKAGKVLNESL